MTRRKPALPSSFGTKLTTRLVLPLALGLSACELISKVDRSKIDDGPSAGASAGGESASGGSNAAGESASGGSKPNAGGDSSSGGSSAGNSASGGGAPGAAGQLQGEGGDPQTAGGDSSAGGSPEVLGGAGPGLSDAGAAGESSRPAGKIIYVTRVPKKSNFGGVVGADAQCNASPPSERPYKALLVDGTSRVACSSAQCATGSAAEGIDWVLLPNTKYVREDGTTVIGTTTDNAIFTFPLDASIGTSGDAYWTGIRENWTTSADTCSGWTETSGVSATQGLADADDVQALYGVGVNCGTLAGAFFACVEQ